MPNREMDAIQVHNAVVSKQWTYSPRFILLGKSLIETTDGARTGRNSQQGLSHLSHIMGTHSAHKHLGQRFGHFRFIALVPLEYLAVKGSFSIVF
jgi:hypothetical protein